MEMVKQNMKKGITKDWGAFVGELHGYSVVEGTEVEIMNQLQRYIPFVYFKAHPIATVTQTEEMITALTKCLCKFNRLCIGAVLSMTSDQGTTPLQKE